MSTSLTLARAALRAIVIAWLALAAAAADAATITVNSLADTTGGAECTLRDAINAANTSMAAGGCPAGSGADTITFAVSGTIRLVSSALPRVLSMSTISIDGTGRAVVISGNNAVPVFVVERTLTLRGVTIADGHKESPGGGGGATVRASGRLIVSHSTFSNNWAQLHGGAIANSGILDVNDSTFSGNSAGDSGGAVAGFLGLLTISRSTFVGNHAGTFGSALYFHQVPFHVFNSTISGNSAGAGGGIYNTGLGDIINTTIAANNGIGLLNAVGGSLSLINSLIAGNTGGDCRQDGTLHSSWPNLIADGSCAASGALTGNPMLGPLADNGGPTLTHALLPGSPAIDAGDDAVWTTFPTDQRGSPRAIDGNRDGSVVSDLGAYEFSWLYDFSGFFEPVDNLPTVNAIKAGRAVPVTFSLGGDHGLNIFAPGSPSSQRITCDSGAPVSDVQQTTTAGASTLTYDAPTDRYTYVWKTDKVWAGTCRQFVVRLVDGTFHVASFQMK